MRKKPGPHPEKPLNLAIRIRMDQETVDMIKFCMEKRHTTCSDILRTGVREMYERLQK